MKKMMILALVMGMASFASAGLLEDITLEWDNVAGTVDLIMPATPYSAGFGIYVSAADDALATVTAAAATANAGDLGAMDKWAGWNGVDVTILASSEGTVTAGLMGTFEMTTALSEVTFDIYDYAVSSATPIGAMSVVVPEPMTMALLGLGGLFLRRRK